MHKTLYDKIREALRARDEAERFLRNGLKDNTLMVLEDGTIRPRYCQFCAEVYGQQSVPKVQMWEFNLSDEEIEIVRKSIGTSDGDHFWRKVEEVLKVNGWDCKRLNFLPPYLHRGKQYACFCDVCGLNAGWYLEYKDALMQFDKLVKEQVEYAVERGTLGEDDD